jgi:hypothetical protein
MKKTILLTSIGLLLLVGVISLNMTQARADGNQNSGWNNQNQNSVGIISLTHTINSTDLVNSVVIGPVTTPIFTMIFNTTSDYNGNAQFQIQQNDGTWIPIGIKQSRGFMIVDGVDAIPAAHLKIPLTIRVAIITQATTGSSYTELDYVGSQNTNQNTGGDNDNDNDNEGNDQDKQSDDGNNQNQQQSNQNNSQH